MLLSLKRMWKAMSTSQLITVHLCIGSWMIGACTHERPSPSTVQRQSEVVRGRGKIRESLASTPVNTVTVTAA